MNIKKFTLINTILGSLSTIAVAFVTYFNPEYASAINASILIGTTAISNIIYEFVIDKN